MDEITKTSAEFRRAVGRRTQITRTRTLFSGTKYNFALVGDNGEIVATSGSQRYSNKSDLMHTVRTYFPDFAEQIEDFG